MNIRIQPRLCALVVALFALAPTVRAEWQPGLLGGFVYNGQTDNLNLVDIPVTQSVWMDPAATTSKVCTASAYYDYPPMWADYRTWRYAGQIWLEAGTINFKGTVDDRIRLEIDGELVMRAASNVGAASGGLTIAEAGWHDFTLWAGNGNGGAGGTEAAGFLMQVNGGAWFHPADDGTMSRFRYDDGLGFPDSLFVRGSPEEWGVVQPPYGDNHGLADGESIACAAPAVVNLPNGHLARCVGWTIYTNGQVKATGVGTNLTYTHCGGYENNWLVWKWEPLINASATAGGTVSPAQAYVDPDGPDITLTATPDTGYAFLCWSGEVIRPSDVTSPVITVPPNVPRSLVAVFTNGVPHPRYSGGFGDGFDMAEATGPLGGVQIGFDSAARQVIERTFKSVAAETFTIRDGTPAAIAAGELAITIPASVPLKWDASVTTVQTTGSLGATVTYRDGGKTAVIPVSSAFGDGAEATISGLSYTNAVQFAFPERLSLDIDGDGLADAYSSGIVGVTVSRPGAPGSGSAFAENAAAEPVFVPPPTLMRLR